MWRFKYIFSCCLLFSILSIEKAVAQDPAEEEVEDFVLEEPEDTKTNILSLGFAFDYLKLHTLLLDDSEKWEGAVNIRFYEKASLIGEYGIADLRPVDAYKNADYQSVGNYFRVGADYHLTVLPGNFMLLGIRYSQASFEESFSYEVENPIFENESGEIVRSNLTASWIELVMSSEKKVKKVFKRDIPDFLSIGFRLRLKTNLNYPEFDTYEVKHIPGYGQTNINLNPEVNLYLKFRLNIF